MGGSGSKVDAQSKGKDDAVEVRPTDPDLYSNYGGIQAYIAVKTDLVDKVLQEGYKCAKRAAVHAALTPFLESQAYADMKRIQTKLFWRSVGLRLTSIAKHVASTLSSQTVLPG